MLSSGQANVVALSVPTLSTQSVKPEDPIHKAEKDAILNNISRIESSIK